MNIANMLRTYCASPARGSVMMPEPRAYMEYDSSVALDDPYRAREALDVDWKVSGSRFGVSWWCSPLVAGPLMPSMVNVEIPDQMEWPAESWAPLEARDSVHQADWRASKLGIAHPLSQALTHWSRQDAEFAKRYAELPLESAIRIRKLEMDVSKMHFEIIEADNSDDGMLSAEELQHMWKLDSTQMPVTVPFECLTAKGRLQDAVELVQLRNDSHFNAIIQKQLNSILRNSEWVMKAFSSAAFYHEIKGLLAIPPHTDIAARPPALVTMKSAFSGKDLVCGFLLKYYQGGTLAESVPLKARKDALPLSDQLSWAEQLTAALIHVDNAGFFFSDLKSDNIVLDVVDNRENIVLIDFSMGRTLTGWAAPEFYYLEWIVDLSSSDMKARKHNHFVVPDMQHRADRLLHAFLDALGNPDIPTMHGKYANPPLGYYYPWLLSSPRDRESATVYMLGRILWCIFEGVSEGHDPIGRSLLYETDHLFPQFRRTPPQLQPLIRSCTLGAYSVLGD